MEKKTISEEERYLRWMKQIIDSLSEWAVKEKKFTQNDFDFRPADFEYYKLAQEKIKEILSRPPSFFKFPENIENKLILEKIEKWTTSEIEIFNLKNDDYGHFYPPDFYKKAQEEVKDILNKWSELIVNIEGISIWDQKKKGCKY